ncbi:MAG: RNA polymerase sigma factor [Planctomycetota bacterium]|jgi:RNA polymerase sigma-70 factor (ECF subfamily)
MKDNRSKFDDIYDKFHEKIAGYLERMVGREESEDLTQEVFIKIDKGLKEFKGDSTLSTWIYRISTNTALDRIRSRSFQNKSHEVTINELGNELNNEGANLQIEQTSLSAEREAIRNEMNDCIREFVDRLPIDYRTIIILSEIKDLKNREIADILGVSLDTAKIRLHRARARLKEIFEEGCDFYHDKSGRVACDRKQKKSENQQN